MPHDSEAFRGGCVVGLQLAGQNESWFRMTQESNETASQGHGDCGGEEQLAGAAMTRGRRHGLSHHGAQE